MGQRVPRARADDVSRQRDARSDARLANPRLHARRGDGDGAPLRRRARLPRGPGRAERGPERRQPYDRRDTDARARPATGRGAGGSLAGADRRGRTVPAHVRVAHATAPRIRHRATAARLGGPAEERRRRIAPACALRTDAGGGGSRAGRVVGGALWRSAHERDGLEQHDRGAGRAGAAAEGSDRLVQRRVARVVRDLRREVRGGP